MLNQNESRCLTCDRVMPVAEYADGLAQVCPNGCAVQTVADAHDRDAINLALYGERDGGEMADVSALYDRITDATHAAHDASGAVLCGEGEAWRAYRAWQRVVSLWDVVAEAGVTLTGTWATEARYARQSVNDERDAMLCEDGPEDDVYCTCGWAIDPGESRCHGCWVEAEGGCSGNPNFCGCDVCAGTMARQAEDAPCDCPACRADVSPLSDDSGHASPSVVGAMDWRDMSESQRAVAVAHMDILMMVKVLAAVVAGKPMILTVPVSWLAGDDHMPEGVEND